MDRRNAASLQPDVAILHADGGIIVVDKPAGVVVHRAPGYPDGTLCDILVRKYPEIAEVGSRERPGVVHRLDRDTSGVMVFARTQRAYLALRREFESHEDVGKTYIAVVHGKPRPTKGEIETPIGRKAWDAKRMAVVDAGGLPARTRWETLGSHGGVSLVEFSIATGRTHQIRVHAAHIGNPIVGDPLYGDSVRDRHLPCRPSRMLLHAVALEFIHPVTRRKVLFSAPPPPDMVYC